MHITGSVTRAFSRVDNTAVGYNRTFYRFNYFKKRNLVWSSAENESPTGTAIGFDQADFAELLEYFGQKGGGHIYCCSNIAQQADLFRGAGCQVHDPTYCVFSLAGQLHHMKKTPSPAKQDKCVDEVVSNSKNRKPLLTH
jgi:hypothetical protein